MAASASWGQFQVPLVPSPLGVELVELELNPAEVLVLVPKILELELELNRESGVIVRVPNITLV